MTTTEENAELYALVKPINPRFIEKPPAGKYGSYVPHFVISQILIGTVGPFDWELVEILRGYVPDFTTKDGKIHGALENAIIGCVYRMTLVVDGKTVRIEETGSAQQEAYENNDGERLKKASSDALKRCAMRLGVGIHLWCKRDEQYIVRSIMDFYRAETPEELEHETVVGVEEADDDGE